MIAARELGKYWHTIRHLRMEQVLARLRQKLPRPNAGASIVLPLRDNGGKLPFIPKIDPVVDFGRLRFIGEERDIGQADPWNDTDAELLWLYNLHYFDLLCAATAQRNPDFAGRQLAHWVAHNPPGSAPGWDPYPTSLRIVNWIKFALSGTKLAQEIDASLSRQALWLERRLERHLLGNHLFANAKALWFAGHYFRGPRAEGLLATALRILDRQLDEQILPDGFHFELSPMYHAIILEDVLDMIAISDVIPLASAASMRTRLAGRVPAMIEALAAMTHPDGGHSFFNDAAFGISASLLELGSFATQLGLGNEDMQARARHSPAVRRLSDAGYVRIDYGNASAILDVGEVGPAYLPGHAHADSLSCELSIHGERVIVNGGTSCYGTGTERLRQRGTAAHSTVTLDEENSSEVWSGFRVARRAHPFDLSVRETGAGIEVSCAHNGYRRLNSPATHRRGWFFRSNALTIDDYIEGRRPHRAQARLLLHPAVTLHGCDQTRATLELASGRNLQLRVEGGVIATEETLWSPRFGEQVPSICLAISFRGSHCQTMLEW